MDCRDILHAALLAVDPEKAVQRHVQFDGKSTLTIGEKRYDLSKYQRFVIVAFGKASSAMATAVIDSLEPALTSSQSTVQGVVIVKDDHATPDQVEKLAKWNIIVREAAHPVPDERSVDASKELLQLVRDTASNETLVLACISGGGSALFCAPHSELTLEDLKQTNSVLLQSGWPIQSMNIVRKRLELGKGGRLAAAAYPGEMAALILSDILGDPLDLIASGPTVADESTFRDAWTLVSRLPEGALPERVVRLLQRGVEGSIEGSPSQEHPAFKKCYNYLVGNNALAVEAAALRASQLGYHPVVLSTRMEGEAREVARVLVALSDQLQNGSSAFAIAQLPAALIAGGETTVTLPPKNHGKGGRNQELALQAAMTMSELKLDRVVLAACGTDGTDGPTDAAGAIVDSGTIKRLGGSAGKALEEHNAYTYLTQQDSNGNSPLLKVSLIDGNLRVCTFELFILTILDTNRRVLPAQTSPMYA